MAAVKLLCDTGPLARIFHRRIEPNARNPRSAGLRTCCIADFQIGQASKGSERRRVWKPAIQQTGKSALRFICEIFRLAAFFNRRDQYHAWAAEQLDRIFEPLLTCAAVVSETVFLLQDDGLAADPVFEAIERGKRLVNFSAGEHWPALRRMVRKYADLPMSLADACLVRMAEVTGNCRVFTTDRHFRIYRRHGRHLIPLLAPF
jgi:predicted nucleic acid-binding protein